ncbi:neuraminidase-like domain-containing protein, partial [Zooshikella sp. RANM57]|uniref:neuraminidase-like domain-containing protein n=1 Tax=Zooshikella sp. RANM57 TaxID=3425863 RepID=UPI003D6EC4AF
AWTDWEEIVAPISAINDEVRPVIFNNRLYIAWQEWESEPDASDPTAESRYKVIKIIYQKFNGDWSASNNFRITDYDYFMNDGADD